MKFILEGSIVPKARPRANPNGGRSFTPTNYRNWQKDAYKQLNTQDKPSEPLSGVKVLIKLEGKHSRRGDCDNVAGSILDALVKCDILKDDNLKQVRALSIELEYSNSDPIALIELEE